MGRTSKFIVSIMMIMLLLGSPTAVQADMTYSFNFDFNKRKIVRLVRRVLRKIRRQLADNKQKLRNQRRRMRELEFQQRSQQAKLRQARIDNKRTQAKSEAFTRRAKDQQRQNQRTLDAKIRAMRRFR